MHTLKLRGNAEWGEDVSEKIQIPKPIESDYDKEQIVRNRVLKV
jgi:hypothetical protein